MRELFPACVLEMDTFWTTDSKSSVCCALATGQVGLAHAVSDLAAWEYRRGVNSPDYHEQAAAYTVEMNTCLGFWRPRKRIRPFTEPRVSGRYPGCPRCM